MTSFSGSVSAAVIDAYDFTGITKLVDVGGGHGLLLASILQKYPQIRGVLFEAPFVAEGAGDAIKERGLTGRCEVVGGDFFASAPAAGDAYIMKNIVQDWDDEHALIILQNCHRAMTENGKLLVVEMVIPEGTVTVIVALAYLYNYSGMAFTLGAAGAQVGAAFPLLSGYLGWVACFLSDSDTASNLLFGNLQVAAAHQLHLSPVLLAATNSSGAVAGKMISPQNIAVGVTTVSLIGQEGKILRATFWHNILLAAILSLVAFAQAYWVPGIVP
jgi:L-lactate permease/O-methyltransferase domain